MTPPRTPSAVPDVLAPGLDVVFCGINPGRFSDAAQAHFANPRNDFWRLLHAAGFTPRLYAPTEQFELLSARSRHHECRVSHDPGLRRPAQGAILREARSGWTGSRTSCAPGQSAFVGKEAYRGVFGERPELGLQSRRLLQTSLFVLPSTSPANAAVPWAERLRWFRALKDSLS